MVDDVYSGRMCTAETYRNVPPEKMSSSASVWSANEPLTLSSAYVNSAPIGAAKANHSNDERTADTKKWSGREAERDGWRQGGREGVFKR
jgi:hypothetical protein